MGLFDYKLGINEPIPKKMVRNLRSESETPINHVTIGHTKRFHQKKGDIRRIVMGTIGKNEVIYGEVGLRARFPRFLQRHTDDIDVYSRTPRRDAVQAERALDRAFQGNYFYIKKAQHPKTWKVIAYANEQGVADFSEMPQNTRFDIIRKHRYLKLSIEKEHRQRSLKDSEFEYRHGKDRDALNRIKIYEKMKNMR